MAVAAAHSKTVETENQKSAAKKVEASAEPIDDITHGAQADGFKELERGSFHELEELWRRNQRAN
jgi:hypothetical protein